MTTNPYSAPSLGATHPTLPSSRAQHPIGSSIFCKAMAIAPICVIWIVWPGNFLFLMAQHVIDMGPRQIMGTWWMPYYCALVTLCLGTTSGLAYSSLCWWRHRMLAGTVSLLVAPMIMVVGGILVKLIFRLQ